MPRYLVRPRATLASRGLHMAGRRLSAAAHAGQMDEVVQARRSEPVYEEVRRWLAELMREAGRERVVALTGMEAHHTPVTGTKVLHMEEHHARRLREEVAGVEVVRDRPLELIRPQKVTASEKEGLEGDDPWHLEAVGLTRGGARTGGKGVTVVVLDTGVHAGHPELAGRIDRAVTFDVEKWTALPQEPSTDTQGHGTHVAGLVCGKTVGVAPEARVVSGVMIPGGIGNLSDFILAMEWAGSQPHVQVINVSAGLPGFQEEMESAVAGLLAVGVLPVVAIGNEGPHQTRSPGNYAEVISVGASTREREVADFSGGGLIEMDGHSYPVPHVVAPGEKVYSCVRSGGYEAWNGTSMATPIVAGIAARVLEREPQIPVTDLYEELLHCCRDLGLPVERQGEGLVQVPAQ